MPDADWTDGLLAGAALGAAVMAIVGVVVAGLAARRFDRLRGRARSAERLAELGTLTGGLAHELNNPLSTVGLNLRLLREDLDRPDADPRVLRRIDTVAGEADRLRETLDDFLRYAGRLELDAAPTDLNRLLEDLSDFFDPQASAHRVRLRLDVPPTPTLASADGKLVKQAVLNLLLNAVQAMPDGGACVVSARRDGRQAVVTVADTGPGVAAEVRGKIFDAYFTRRKGGSGLGLAMAKRIAEEHGGTLAVDDDPGGGARFTLRLPAAR